MQDFETVEAASDTRVVDPLLAVEREGVDRMRTSLLSCSMDDASSAKQAIQQVTILRVYHQVVRIIRYLDLMDKLEEKLYDSIELSIETMSEYDQETWMKLITVQERLQRSMIESHKLLQPYLELQDSSINDLIPEANTSPNKPILMSSESRERVRNTAQAVLTKLSAG